DGPLNIRAILTVGADGRHSLVRQKAGLKIIDVGAPIDVLWMRISRLKTDPEQLLGRIETGKMVALIDRHDYWQCAYVIPKGAAEKIMSEGIESLRAALSELVPFFGDRVQELKDWNDVKLLTVSVNYLEQWFKRGLLCIGDAAHAMSPVGGVGINLAIQDAVATANILSEPLHAGRVRQTDLRLVQGRRMWPTMMTQRMQIFVQKNIILRAVGKTTRPELPFVMKLMNWFPVLQRIPAHFIGVGFRPEHINTTLR
ncbi:MAG: FAD-dependent monooxygenase, partial [Alphaproteobacteria bacterium]